jgi:hypothetical protein
MPEIERPAVVCSTLEINRDMPSPRQVSALANRCSASSINTRIFRDFSGSGGDELAVTEFPNFRKPLHFKEKYVYVE